MSGHSRWSQIKHKKGVSDQKRGQLFSKIAKLITIAAKDDPNPSANPRLQAEIERARAANVPKENIERAIKRAAEKDAAQLSEMFISVIGPASSSFIIKAITDNKNRTLGSVRRILEENRCRMADENSLNWLFDKMAIVKTEGKADENIELELIEQGAENISRDENYLEICGRPETLHKLKKTAESKKLKVVSAEIGFAPKSKIKIENEEISAQIQKLMENLNDNDDVEEVYSNLE